MTKGTEVSAATRTRDARRAEVERLYLRGQSQAEIAQSLECSAAQVSRDLAGLRRSWLARADRSFNVVKAEVLVELEELKRAFWQGWEESCLQREISLTHRREGRDQIKEASLRREPGRQNPAFLNGVARCIDRQARLLGLDCGERYEEDPVGEPLIPMSDAELDTEIRRLLGNLPEAPSPEPRPEDLPPAFRAARV